MYRILYTCILASVKMYMGVSQGRHGGGATGTMVGAMGMYGSCGQCIGYPDEVVPQGRAGENAGRAGGQLFIEKLRQGLGLKHFAYKPVALWADKPIAL